MSMEEQSYVLSVPIEGQGERLDRFLAEQLSHLSRSYVQQLIREGAVCLGGRPAKPSQRLEEGEDVCLRMPPHRYPPVEAQDIYLDIYYEDEDLLIVNKPQGMVVHPAPGHYQGTLVNALLHHCQGKLSGINGVLRPGIIHRIDRDTSGLLAVCKSDFAHRHLAQTLAAHDWTRRYLALLLGRPQPEQGRVDLPIGRHPQRRREMAVVPGGRRAITHYRLLESWDKYSLAECRLETGRTHQIRVHMAALGHPVLGDAVYAKGRSWPFALAGQCLHAAVLGLRHPRTGEYMEWEAPPPEYFTRLLARIRG